MSGGYRYWNHVTRHRDGCNDGLHDNLVLTGCDLGSQKSFGLKLTDLPPINLDDGRFSISGKALKCIDIDHAMISTDLRAGKLRSTCGPGTTAEADQQEKEKRTRRCRHQPPPKKRLNMGGSRSVGQLIIVPPAGRSRRERRVNNSLTPGASAVTNVLTSLFLEGAGARFAGLGAGAARFWVGPVGFGGLHKRPHPSAARQPSP
jgi:hypothetical protein